MVVELLDGVMFDLASVKSEYSLLPLMLAFGVLPYDEVLLLLRQPFCQLPLVELTSVLSFSVTDVVSQ